MATFDQWFVEQDTKNYFAFGARADHADKDHAPGWAADFDQIIYLGANSDERRFAKILKTVAHVVVDEDADGQPVTEKWNIRHVQ